MVEDDADIEIGYYEGPLASLIEGLQDAGLEGSLVGLDGRSKELDRLIRDRTANRPDLQETNYRFAHGTFRLGPIVFGAEPLRWLPIEGDTLRIVRDMLETHADPEIAIELQVRDDEGCLVWAPDAGYNEIWVSRRLPKEAVNALRAALGDGLRPPES